MFKVFEYARKVSRTDSQVMKDTLLVETLNRDEYIVFHSYFFSQYIN